MLEEHITLSASDTRQLGSKLAAEIKKKGPTKRAVLIGLKGELGSGKTIFLQGFGRELGIKEKILSPTFLILRRFQVPGSGFNNFFHIDCYRIKKPQEIINLGLTNIISNSKNIVAFEWVDKIKKVLPEQIILVEFGFLSKNKRRVKIFKNL